MMNNVEYNCVKPLKKPGDPVIIYALPQEAEAVAYACKDAGINVAAFCDNDTRKAKKPFCGLEVVHTPDLPKRFPKARFLIAHQNCVGWHGYLLLCSCVNRAFRSPLNAMTTLRRYRQSLNNQSR